MRFVVAPQEFKGSLTAAQAAAAMAAGVLDAQPDADVRQVAMSDGGAGFVDALYAATGGELVETPAHDPLMRPIVARWVLLRDGAAAIEMAAASGLLLVERDERDPLAATTFGTGELVRAALDRGCTSIIVGVGGSATTDAGAGALQALGLRFLDAHGRDLRPGGGPLVDLDRIDASARDPRLATAAIRVATDVANPLVGSDGAADVYAPQKGASPADVERLRAGLERFAQIAARDLGVDVSSVPGGGAAGGLAAGLIAGAGATIESGFALVAEAVGLEAMIAQADAVITGEGRLDAQTAYGKAVEGVAEIARRHGKRVAVIAGIIDPEFDLGDRYDVVESLLQPGMTPYDAMRDAGTLVRQAVWRALGGLDLA